MSYANPRISQDNLIKQIKDIKHSLVLKHDKGIAKKWVSRERQVN